MSQYISAPRRSRGISPQVKLVTSISLKTIGAAIVLIALTGILWGLYHNDPEAADLWQAPAVILFYVTFVNTTKDLGNWWAAFVALVSFVVLCGFTWIAAPLGHLLGPVAGLLAASLIARNALAPDKTNHA